MPSNDLTGNVIEPELGRHILSEMADLNADFIELITRTDTSHCWRSLPDKHLDQLRALSKPAIGRLTRCAFALFDLRLQDAKLWHALRDCASPKALLVEDISNEPKTRGRISFFTLSALMYLRHLTDINFFFAKLSFGATPSAIDVVCNLPLNRLREIADQYPALLRSRFGQHPEAWTELLTMARRNDTEPMLPAKILGYQHLYQE